MIYGIVVYLVIINIVAFAVYGIDKKKAEKHQWRISERTLFLVAILGGGVGAYAGMKVFHHKTKHWYFQLFIPLITIIWCVALFFLVKYILFP